MLGEGKSGLVEGGWVNKINLLSLLQDFSETLKVQWLLCISKIAYAPFASVSGPELILLLIPPLPMDHPRSILPESPFRDVRGTNLNF